MTANSKVNPNFPIPGLDQSSKGFRDNFSTIKQEIESIQNKTLVFTGALTGTQSVSIDSGDSPIIIDAVLDTNFGNLGIDSYGQVYSIIPNAVGDGVTDDTDALNTYLSGLPSGTTVILQQGKTFYIGSGDLTVPNGVTITANGSPFIISAAYTLEPLSGFVIAPEYSIVLGVGAVIDNLFIRSNLLTPNPTATTVINTVYSWFTSGGIGIRIPQNVGANRITRCFMVGFKTAIRAFAGDFVMQDIWIDSFNGIEISSAGDNFYLQRIRLEPWYALNNNPTTGSWERNGIGFYIHDGDTGAYFDNVFTFMWANGIVLANVGVSTIEGSGFEWQSMYGSGITGTVGARWIGHNAETAIYNSYLNGFNTPASVESVGAIIMSDIYIPGATVTGIYLAGNTATALTATLNGTPVAGEIVTVQITSSIISGGGFTATYTVKPGDSLSSIMSNISDIFIRQQSVIGGRVYTIANSNVLSAYFPADATALISISATGSLTYSTGTTTARTGSYGAIRGINFEFNNVPLITAGDVNGIVNTWQISFNNAALNLFNNWLNIQNLHTASSINLSGIAWNGGASVSGAGTGAFVSGNDGSGTIVLGSSATTTITLNFAVHFPWTPRSITAVTSSSSVTVAVTSLSASSVTFALSGDLSAGKIFYNIFF